MMRLRRSPAGVRLAVVVVTVFLVVGTATVVAVDRAGRSPSLGSPAATPVSLNSKQVQPGAAGPGGRNDRRTLVLYDDGSRYSPNPPALDEAKRAQAYGMFTANLVSRATSWRMHAVADYQAGEAASYQSIVYVGSVYDGVLPQSFVDDVAASTVPVVWIDSNIWQLFAKKPDIARRLGWMWTGYRNDDVTSVEYKGTSLRREAKKDVELMGLRVDTPSKVTVLAETVTAAGARSPWAVRSGNLTYIAEVPYAYMRSGDRYLAAADILLGALAPDTPQRRRAMVRIEDVGPRTDPAQLRAITRELSGRRMPFSLAVYPYYADPHGKANDGRPTYARLVDKPDLVDALRDAMRHGGTLVMHGYSHQYDDLLNPYSGVSADDYEFYRSSVDDHGNVLLDGPVPADSPKWFRDRVATGIAEFERVGLPRPDLFEFPHYGGSAVDYQETAGIFTARYDRGSYYAGQCPGGLCGSTNVSYDEVYGQFFPYAVRDVYGSIVVPENIGNVAPSVFNQHASRSTEEILADARASLVVRDSVVSFFYHPFLGTDGLVELVDSIKGMGYTFVAPADVIRG